MTAGGRTLPAARGDRPAAEGEVAWRGDHPFGLTLRRLRLPGADVDVPLGIAPVPTDHAAAGARASDHAAFRVTHHVPEAERLAVTILTGLAPVES